MEYDSELNQEILGLGNAFKNLCFRQLPQIRSTFGFSGILAERVSLGALKMPLMGVLNDHKQQEFFCHEPYAFALEGRVAKGECDTLGYDGALKAPIRGTNLARGDGMHRGIRDEEQARGDHSI